LAVSIPLSRYGFTVMRTRVRNTLAQARPTPTPAHGRMRMTVELYRTDSQNFFCNFSLFDVKPFQRPECDPPQPGRTESRLQGYRALGLHCGKRETCLWVGREGAQEATYCLKKLIRFGTRSAHNLNAPCSRIGSLTRFLPLPRSWRGNHQSLRCKSDGVLPLNGSLVNPIMVTISEL